MKHSLFFSFLLFLFHPINIFGYSFVENGVYYDITSSTLHTLAVTYYKKIPYRTEYEKKDIVIPETITHGTTTYTVTAIGDYAFEKTSVNSVQLPNSIVSIGKNAFYDCSNITEIALPSSVRSIGENAYYGCTGLTEIDLSNVTSLGKAAFAKCENIKTITISNRLSRLPNSAFSDCKALSEIIIPENITEIGEATFKNCSGLKEVTFPSNLQIIGKNAFAYCTELQEVSFPNSVTKIGESAFNSCSSIKEVIIPNGVTILDDGIFAKCTSLQSVVIPESITKINNDVFNGCNLKIVYSLNPTPPTIVKGPRIDDFYSLRLPPNVFNTYTYDNALLCVPTGSKSLYAVANYWEPFNKNGKDNIVEEGTIAIVKIGETGYTTFAFDKPLDLSVMPEGISAFYVNSVTDESANLIEVSEAVQPGEGLIFKGEAGSMHILHTTTDGNVVTGNLLVGVIEQPVTLVSNPSSAEFVMVNVGGEAKFQCISGGVDAIVPIGKAYLNARESGVKSINLLIKNDIASDMDIPEAESTFSKYNQFYNLMGQPVENPRKGIYIRNGKKVFIK